MTRCPGVDGRGSDDHRAGDPGRRCLHDLRVLIRDEEVPMLEETRVACPYCGEDFDTLVDCSAGSQHYIEDCPVCCTPIEFEVEVDDEGSLITLMTRRCDD
jgi:hypothetical protein